jgi:myosin heavy subunit
MPSKGDEVYEIVPVDPLSQVSRKNERLEKEIHEIRNALRGTAGLSRIESNANQFIDHMLDLMKSSQKMVDEVAKSNQAVAQKIEVALTNMEKTNTELSEKLTKILTFFAQATEAMEEESTGDSQMVTAVNTLNETLSKLQESTSKSSELLSSIERNVKQQRVRSQSIPVPKPMSSAPMPSGSKGAPPLPLPPEAPVTGKAPDLPPPPFPPQ